MDKCFIVTDFGSSSARVSAVNAAGEIIAEESAKISAKFPRENFSEYDAQELFDLHKRNLDIVIEKVKKTHEPVSIAVCAQRSTIFFWDKITGAPLAPAISWQDGRAHEIANAVLLSQKETHAATGLYKTPYYSASKIKWALLYDENVRNAFKEKRLCTGPFTTYFIYRLTGGKQFLCDFTQAQRTLLFNIENLSWDISLLELFGISRKILPEITMPAGDFGDYNGIPITVSIGDQQAACMGLGLENGKCAINYGTGAFVFVSSDSLKFIDGILTSISWDLKSNMPCYLFEGALNSASSSYSWLNQLGLEFDHSMIDQLCRLSKRPVSFLPALGGLGAPYWDYKAQTVISGFKPQTRKEDIVRGLTESIAFFVNDILKAIKTADVTVDEIIAGGGLSACTYLLELQSVMSETGIFRNPTTQSTTIGCAALCAKQAGIDFCTWKSLNEKELIVPKISPKEALDAEVKWHLFFDKARNI